MGVNLVEVKQTKIKREMTIQIEIVAPAVVDGIEFYTSKDGKLSGISQVGCAKLCGVTESAIRQIIKGLNSQVDRSQHPNKTLEHLVGIDLYLALSSGKQAKVLDSKVVASLVTYYALERRNEVAIYSLSKFASIGIDTWIKDVTGYNSSDNSLDLLNQINATMGKLLVKVERLEQIEEETLGYRKATATMPILEKWMSELTEVDKQKLLAPGEQLYTVKEAIDKLKPGCTFSQTIIKKLALKVGQTIASLTDKPVPKKQTLNGRGYMMEVNAYTEAQLPLIGLCLTSIMAEI